MQILRKQLEDKVISQIKIRLETLGKLLSQKKTIANQNI